MIDYTPRELKAAVRGATDANLRDMQLRLWAAHQTAALSRFPPDKPLPEIGPLLAKIRPEAIKPAKPMTPEQIRDSIIRMAKGMDAEIIRVPREEFK